MTKSLCLRLAGTLLMLAPFSLSAADGTWTGATNGSWTDSGNWLGGTIPGAANALGTNSDTATFSGASNLAVTVDTSRSIRNINFEGPTTGAFTLQTGNLYMNNGGAITVKGNVYNTQAISSGINLLTNAVVYTLANESLNSGVLLSANTINSANSGVLTLGGNGLGEVTGAITNSVGNLGVSKTGSGTWTMKGGSSYNAATTFNNGKLIIDYAGASSGTNTNYGLKSTGSLAGGGGTIEFLAKAGATTNQLTSSLVTSTFSGVSEVIANLNGGTALNLTLTDVSRQGGSTILYDISSGGQIVINDPSLHGTSLVKTGSGVFFAQANNSAVSALATTSLTSTSGAGAIGTNYQIAASDVALTPATTFSARTIRIDSTGSVDQLSIAAGKTLVYAQSILYVGNNDFTVTGGGSLKGPGLTNNEGLLVQQFGSGTITFDSSLTVGAGTGSSGFYGTGLVDIAYTAAMTGGAQVFTTVRVSSDNSLNLTNAGTGGNAGALHLGDGGILELNTSTNFTRNVNSAAGAGRITWTGNGGFSAFGAERTVNLSAGAGLTWGSGGFVADGAIFILGSAYSNANLVFKNAIDFGSSNRVVQVNNGTVNGDIDATLEGNLTGAGGMLSKTGSGTLSLKGTNTYTGMTMINAGTLVLSSTGSIASSEIGFGVSDGASGLLTVENSSFAFGGTLSLSLSAVTVTSGTWTLFNGAEFGIGDLNLASLTSDLGGLTFTNNSGIWTGTDASSRVWTFSEDIGQLTVIPEPSSWALLTMGLTSVLLLRRRRTANRL